ncbi:hypothetical protein CCP3SC1_970012 [Gammaproteobacteria bacterium]
MGLTYDAASHILGITETGFSSKGFSYDPLGRLTNFTTGTDSTTLAYDANGNRLQSTATAGATSYTYPATNNRLTKRSGVVNETNTYDATGNLIKTGSRIYSYDARGRMTQAQIGTVTTAYGINGLGQRVSKNGESGATEFAYDEAGHLLGEYDASGNAIEETVWLGDIPVAVLTGTGASAAVYYVNANQLNAPRIITDKNGKRVWNWDPLAFGNTKPNQNPSNLGTFVYTNLRVG